MTNDEYAAAVDSGAYPETTSVPIGDEFSDDRGAINNILLTPITSVARITSVPRAVRANHYHRTDWHYALVESGTVLYFERAIGSTEIPEPHIYRAGEMFFTPPMREHAMLFAEPSVIYTFAKNVRNHDTHEADLVRVEFITPEIAAAALAKL
jgi:quercetin dioxygenase-like cupin family protein